MESPSARPPRCESERWPPVSAGVCRVQERLGGHGVEPRSEWFVVDSCDGHADERFGV
jgi:hypothetical protein